MNAPAPRTGYADLFGTPLLTQMLPDHERLNEELGSVILRRREQDAGVQMSNLNGWHSDINMTDWGGESARHLAQKAGELAMRFTLDPGSPNAPRIFWSVIMWANVSGPGGGNHTHAHPGAFWSMVYYVEDGGAATDPAMGGELCLNDPRYPMCAMAAPDLFYRGSDGAPKRSEQLIRPKPGLLVGFPSWLQHSVKPYRGDGLRISIAMNFTPKALPGAAQAG